MEYVKIGNTGLDVSRICSSVTTHRSATDAIQKSKYDPTAEADRFIIERVANLATKHGVPRVHIALAWLLQKDQVAAPSLEL